MKRTLALLAVTTLYASQPSRAVENPPVPPPTPAPVLAAVNGQTRTLADVARERKLGKKGVQGGTLSVAGAPVSPASAAAGAPVPRPGGALVTVDTDEAVWTRRNADARAELASAREALDYAGNNLPVWSVTGRGSAYSAAMLSQMRDAALLPYREREAAARAAVAALPEAARKAGASPGWVRGEEVKADRKISLAETERQLNNGDAPLPARDRDDRGTTR
jgi:hypothetical protein